MYAYSRDNGTAKLSPRRKGAKPDKGTQRAAPRRARLQRQTLRRALPLFYQRGTFRHALNDPENVDQLFFLLFRDDKSDGKVAA